MEGRKGSYRVLNDIYGEKRPLVRPTLRWGNDIKMGLQKV
jgi:hypothetical protein